MILALCVTLTVVQAQGAPAALDASTFKRVHAYAAPSEKDLSFQSLDWKPSVFEGLQAAQRADKPILLWQYFGDPRGHC